MAEKTDLSPSIHYIKHLLGQNSGDIPTLVSDESPSLTEPAEEGLDDIPETIKHLIQREVDAQTAFSGLSYFQSGQIREIKSILNPATQQPIQLALSLLLISKNGNHWKGVLVSPYAAYLSDRDVLIESVYEPQASNKVGVIHTNFELTLSEDNLGAVQTVLTPNRLQAVLEVQLGEFERSQPSKNWHLGQLINAQTQSGHEVTIGTPLNEQDVRIDYHALLGEVAQWAQTSPKVQTTSLFERLWMELKSQKAVSRIPATAYAMSQTSQDKLQWADIELYPEIEAEDILQLRLHNPSSKPVKMTIFKQDQLEQNIQLEPNAYDVLYLEKGYHYAISVSTESTTMTLEFTL